MPDEEGNEVEVAGSELRAKKDDAGEGQGQERLEVLVRPHPDDPRSRSPRPGIARSSAGSRGACAPASA